ncbi:AraC family transcriptional regulator [Chitinophaga sp. S165]|uniref:helix-turn-helix domain-containing protein n=1 Tax=Chitinophaga sp. S165 TaxID=2135462 RepID=UPI000D71A0F5|nr:helix-turn-helix transcriptional regulator [Chitinophaga sp. S165]PWV47760.1 AraC-like DNA-binding protein [Chitinophaga sp. S165]
MQNRDKIPIYSKEDWLSGVYIKQITPDVVAKPLYESGQPHRHDFYYCVLLEKGEMEMEVDFKKIRLTDHSLFISYPGQIHRIISLSAERGWFLAFETSMLNEELKNVLDQCLSEIIHIVISSEQFIYLSSFIQHLYRVYNDGDLIFRSNIIQAMTPAFLYQAMAIYLIVERSGFTTLRARSVEITRTFRQLLRRNYKFMKRPSEFASKMNVTVSHLNDTVRSVTGFPVTYCIHQEVMLEARRLLFHSDLTIKEIAGDLGYDDEKYFMRLFTKVVGISPGNFRNGTQTTSSY